MYDIKVRLAKDKAFPIHEYAALVALAIPAEQAALMADIKENGQREPITLWRGAVVDGRCRQTALTTLGLNIMYKELDDDTDEEFVKGYVKSVNTRRNLTHTQKVMSAAKEHMTQTVKKSLTDVAKSWGISKNILANAKWLYANHPEVAEGLFNAKGIQIVDKQGKTVVNSRVSTVYAYYRKLAEAVVEVDVPHGWKADSAINTQAGKDFFYSLDLTNPTQVEMMATELANFKYPRGDV